MSTGHLIVLSDGLIVEHQELLHATTTQRSEQLGRDVMLCRTTRRHVCMVRVRHEAHLAFRAQITSL